MEDLLNREFIGVVEKKDDDKKLGRVKVRVLNVYDGIPLEDIPWATPYKDDNGNEFNIPDIGKVITIVFPDGNKYMPQYLSAKHYNINLEAKLSSLSIDDYEKFKAILFDHSTQLYRSPSDGLKIDHEYSNINITSDGDININLRDNGSMLHLGTPDGNQAAVLGTNWMNWFDKLVSELLGEGGGPFMGNMGAPVVTQPSLINVLLEYKSLRDNKFLSDHVWLPENNMIKGQNRPYNAQEGDSWNSTLGPNNITSGGGSSYSPLDRDAINNSIGSDFVDAEQTDMSGLDLSKTPWVTIAKRELGQKEIKTSGGHNQRIVEYLKTTGNFGTDETPWCSAFVNWSMRKAGIKGTNSASAISWSKWGNKLKGPAYGAIAVINYGGGKGHVGMVVGINKSGNYILLGGNQSDSVKYSSFSKSSIQTFAFPTGVDPQYKLPLMDISGGNSYKDTR